MWTFLASSANFRSRKGILVLMSRRLKDFKLVTTRAVLNCICIVNCPFFGFTRTWLRFLRVYVYCAIANPSVVCLLSVTFVRPTHRVEASSNISSPLCTLPVYLWPSCKILRRSSQGNPSVGGVKRKRGNKIERCWTCRRLYLINGTRYGRVYVTIND